MTDQSTDDFDFEYWAKLAREDPETFEARRAELVSALVESAPEGMRHRLRGLQWQLDQIRQRAGTPLAACMDMSRMMWENLLGEDGLLDAMYALGKRGSEAKEKPAAAVLAFRKKPDE